jgi:hypothetical protein
MFVLIGLPGLVLAAIAGVSLKEPRRHQPATALSSESRPSLKEVYATLWANVTFRHLLLAYALLCFFSYGMLNWQPVFFVRSFGLKTGQLGTWFAVVYGLPGILGTYLGGEWASRRAANNERLQLKAMAVINAAFNGMVWALIYFSHNYYMAFALMGLSTLGGTAIIGPLFAAMQTVVPARMRAVSIAIVLLFANLIGLGLGPLAVGVISDALRPLYGPESLRYALLALCPGYAWVSWHLWKASKTFSRDLDSPSGDANNDKVGDDVASPLAVSGVVKSLLRSGLN